MGHFIKSRDTRILNMGNPRSRSVYVKGKATSRQISKNFGPDFIKSDMWFHILKFVSQKFPLSPKSIVEALKVLQSQLYIEALFLQYNNKIIKIISDQIPINNLPMDKMFSIH